MKLVAGVAPFLFFGVVFAAYGDAFGSLPSKSFTETTDKEIGQVLERIHQQNSSVGDRITKISEYFLKTPYPDLKKPGPMGEGPKGEFDRGPLHNFKVVDCTTLVEQVMALALEPDLDTALQTTLQKIRYKNGDIRYESRNHFPEADWIPNNVAAGFITDITETIGGDKVWWARKTISKRAWYEKKEGKDMHGFEKEPAAQREERLKRFRALGAHFEDVPVKLPYIPIGDLPTLLNRIPSGTIANLVREDQPDKPTLISHQVFIIEKNGVKYVRHAAKGKFVMDVSAKEYFDGYLGNPWKLLGVNLNAVRGS